MEKKNEKTKSSKDTNDSDNRACVDKATSNERTIQKAVSELTNPRGDLYCLVRQFYSEENTNKHLSNNLC